MPSPLSSWRKERVQSRVALMSCPRVTRPDRRPEGLPEGRPDRRRWCRVPRSGRSHDPLGLRGCGTCASRPQTGHAQGDVVLVPVCAMAAVPDAFGAFTEAKVASLVVALGAAVAGRAPARAATVATVVMPTPRTSWRARDRVDVRCDGRPARDEPGQGGGRLARQGLGRRRASRHMPVPIARSRTARRGSPVRRRPRPQRGGGCRG